MEENNRDNKDLSERAVAAAVTPIPWKKLLSLCIIATAETINYSSIYPYVNFMVKDFGVVDDERKLGYWVGLIASSVYLANFFSSYIWGRISDRYGRRPGLLAGLIGGTILSTLLFGFSKSFYWAVTTRFLSGLLNGNTGIAKTMLGEITDKTNQARAFSLFGLTWSIGGIVGPLIGGLLSKPTEQYPAIFGGVSFFKIFPYLLPNIAVASLGVLGLIVAIFTLPETKKNVANNTSGETQELLPEENGSNSISMDEISVETSTDPSHSSVSEGLVSHTTVKQISPWRRILTGVRTCKMNAILPHVLLDRTVQLTCWLYAILGFIWVIYEEVFPLWSLNAPQSGGLSFTQRDIGIIQAGGGVFTLTFQIFMYPHIAKKLKLVGTFRWGIIIGLPGFIAMPEVNRIATQSRVWVWVCTGVLVILQQASSEMTFVSVIILVSNSSLTDTMGTVNGYAQSLVAMLRLFGPFSGSSLLSWSITNELGFPFDHHFIFFVVGTLFLFMLGLSFGLPNTINEPKTSNDLPVNA